jgi:nucleotide-binding universal stress UspA family protein
MINIRNVLYATDFSPYSNQAYFHAVAIAESHGARLTIVHVFTPGSVVSSSESPDERAHWRGQLQQIRPVNVKIPVQHILLEGNAADQIIGYAAANQTDLIVMGTHGRTGLERLLMGSVAEKVLRNAPCSVLVVKMPKAAPAAEKSESTP